jgi:hypothetical protein
VKRAAVVRVHFGYELDPYAEDLERFASWLLTVGYPNKTARTHLFRVQQVLDAIGGPSGAVIDAQALERAYKRLAEPYNGDQGGRRHSGAAGGAEGGAG